MEILVLFIVLTVILFDVCKRTDNSKVFNDAIVFFLLMLTLDIVLIFMLVVSLVVKLF